MLYTIVPMDVIYPEKIAPPVYERQNGVLFEMRRDVSGRYAPARLLTTDLKKYL